MSKKDKITNSNDIKWNMHFGADPIIFEKAEELRARMTPAEEILWNVIKINKWRLKFRRQHPLSAYIADFYCHKVKLVVELDGGYHENKEVKIHDAARENEIKELGITVLRFKNEEIINNIEIVLNKISETINSLKISAKNIVESSNNSPLGDGGIATSSNNSPSGDGGGGRGSGKTLFIIKIGGNIIDDESKLSSFLEDFSGIETKKILVHGGGKLATTVAEAMGIPQQLIDGRRITDGETLKVITMVYAGYINKNIVAQLQAMGCDALGVTGADANMIPAHKRIHPQIDYGFVGDIDSVNRERIQSLLQSGLSLVFAPVTHDQNGLLLNTNADTIAQEIASAMSPLYDVELIYCFEKNGVLMNANDDSTLIPKISHADYTALKNKNIISAGMMPKLDNAFAAVNKGVKKVIIGNAAYLKELTLHRSGTIIENE
jgi:acetylglutamate kinase